MNRREVIAGIGGTVLLPLAARAQQRAMPVIGYLGTYAPGARSSELLAAFHKGLGETGFVEGKNVSVEYRWADNENDRLPVLAADLVGRQVTVIVAPEGTPSAVAAKAATSAIPIVFAIGSDPLAVGLVANLSRPGGNVTGVTTLSFELAPKWLELLHELVPTTRVFALLVNPTSSSIAEATTREVQTMARTLGLELHVLNASTDRDLDVAFAALGPLKVGGLIISPDALFSSRPERLAELSLRNAMPAVYWVREFAAAGGLMSYGTNRFEAQRQTGIYTGRILKGEKPADLPVVHSSKVDLVINLKTAKALGLTIPITLLGRADEVIE